jgi:hypothetical protein
MMQAEPLLLSDPAAASDICFVSGPPVLSKRRASTTGR